MEFLEIFLKDYAAPILAGLAVWASWRANSHAKTALEQTESVKLLELQSEALREIDRQNAKLGSLLTTLAETALVYSQDEHLQLNDPQGYSRIRNNIESVKNLRERYEEQRTLAEQNVGSGSVEMQTKILSEIRRLTIHVEEDIEKESRNLERLRQGDRTAQQSTSADSAKLRD